MVGTLCPCLVSMPASKLVGPSGRVVGLDMTAKQLEIANAHVDWHMQVRGQWLGGVGGGRRAR